MGKLIDTDKLKDIIEYCILANVPADAENTKEEKWNDWFQTVIDRAQPVEAIPKDQYEARLKADMVAMLEELEKELKEVKCNYLATIHVDIAEEYFNLAKVEGLYLIRQKISKLKGDEE